MRTNLSPEQIAESWVGKFSFKKEIPGVVAGLRSPQVGALYALMAHAEDGDQSAIVVMPTGTGKTETMLSFLVANQCHRVFVVVPSDALRSQTYRKFNTLGLLPKIGIVPDDILKPKVIRISEELNDADWTSAIDNHNVVITTMTLAAKMPDAVKRYVAFKASYLFIDEAHHSEARTWRDFISIFPQEKVLMFTATPYRNDGQRLTGKIVFNFSLKKAQEQGYYERINYIPVVEYSKEDADRAIAKAAVEQLKKDIAAGYNHIMMARCKDIKRAREIFKIYQEYPELSPIIVHSKMAGAAKALRDIKNLKHRVIVCVNMLGEGYDLPQLKIAAVHDEKQSLAITLQFIGRFTRTNATDTGQATFITNIAYAPISEEINSLYRQDADWNLIVPRLSEDAATEQQKLSDFLQDFNGNLKNEISLEDVRPALSAQIFRVGSTTTNFNNWKEGFKRLSTYDYVLEASNRDFLVIVLGKKEIVKWGDVQSVANLEWQLIVVYFDARRKLVYLNSSMDLKGDTFLSAIFDNPIQLSGERMYRVFHKVNRIDLYNLGARLPKGKDISFQSYYGSSVEDGIDLISQGSLLKNNVFGRGYRDGRMISLGCSNKGKVWSRERADLLHYKEWCNMVGSYITDETIPCDTILKNTMSAKPISSWPSAYPLSIDWNYQVYKQYSQMLHLGSSFVQFDEVTLSLEVPDDRSYLVVQFEIDEQKAKLKISYNSEQQKCTYELVPGSLPLKFIIGDNEITPQEYFDAYPPTIHYHDNSSQEGVNIFKPKATPPAYPISLISTLDWTGVDLHKESIWKGQTERVDSIQYFMANKVLDKHDYLINDDGSGEVADLIGLDVDHDHIDITLYHLKYAEEGKVSKRITNLYEVCGQAQKSERWKHIEPHRFFENILKRDAQKRKKRDSGNILKGDLKGLLKIKEEAQNKKELRFHAVIVQPGMSKSACTAEMLELLGVTYQFLHQVAAIDLKVICSE